MTASVTGLVPPLQVPGVREDMSVTAAVTAVAVVGLFHAHSWLDKAERLLREENVAQAVVVATDAGTARRAR